MIGLNGVNAVQHVAQEKKHEKKHVTTLPLHTEVLLVKLKILEMLLKVLLATKDVVQVSERQVI